MNENGALKKAMILFSSNFIDNKLFLPKRLKE